MQVLAAIGDIHGCADSLEKLLANLYLGYPDGGKIVTVGDYVDRGPDSKRVLDLLMQGTYRDRWKIFTLMGNHEEMLMWSHSIPDKKERKESREHWIDHGGQATLNSFGGTIPDNVIEWIARLPLYYEDEDRVIAHAGVNDTLPLKDNHSCTLLWGKKHPLWQPDVKFPPVPFWGKTLVTGHIPTNYLHVLDLLPHVRIDTGAVYGHKLSAAVFPINSPEVIEIVSVNGWSGK